MLTFEFSVLFILPLKFSFQFTNTYHLFIHFHICGKLGCFQSHVSIVVMNNFVCVSLYTWVVIPVWHVLRSGTAMHISMFTFIDIWWPMFFKPWGSEILSSWFLVYLVTLNMFFYLLFCLLLIKICFVFITISLLYFITISLLFVSLLFLSKYLFCFVLYCWGEVSICLIYFSIALLSIFVSLCLNVTFIYNLVDF